MARKDKLESDQDIGHFFVEMIDDLPKAPVRGNLNRKSAICLELLIILILKKSFSLVQYHEG